MADKDLPLLFKSPDLMSAFFKISGGTTYQKIDVVAEKFCHLQRDLVEIQYQKLQHEKIMLLLLFNIDRFNGPASANIKTLK